MPVVTRLEARHPRHAARRNATWVVLVLALVLTACASRADVQANQTATGSPTDAASPSGTASAAADPSATTSFPDSTESARGDAGPEPPIVIRWIRQYAPEGGGGPTREAAYSLLTRGECASAYTLALDDTNSGPQQPLPQPFRNLYAAAAAACLAAFEGQADRWQDADSRLESVQRNEFDCWEQEIYDITAQIIDVHESEPRAVFERSSGGGSSSCPRVTGIDPDHGPQGGGYPVRIVGENLPTVLPLYFGDFRVDAVRQPNGSTTVDVPRVQQPGSVTVTLEGAPGRGVSPTQFFTYDPPPGDETTLEEPSDNPTTDAPAVDEPTTDQPASDEPTQ